MKLSSKRQRKPLVLLLASASHPAKDLIASTLAWMCKDQQVEFDVYYASGDEKFIPGGGEHHQSHQGGALFSVHGSMLIGGRHHQSIARVLAEFETTVVKIGAVHVFDTLVLSSASTVLEPHGTIVDLLETCSQALGREFPKEVVAVQTEGLPLELKYGIAQYVSPEVMERRAAAVPLELQEQEISALAKLGVGTVWTISTHESSMAPWEDAGIAPKRAIELGATDTYLDVTFRIAEKWKENLSGFDLCEPVLASYWMPFVIRERRAQVIGENVKEAVARLVPLVLAKDDRVVYGRYAGGYIGGAKDDEDYFELFRNDISFQVIEPGRPVLRVTSRNERRMPQPAKAPSDLQPTDIQLGEWASKGKILTTLMFHSGEMSHDDAVLNVMDLCALTKVHVGLPVHVQRYLFNPDCVEPMSLPVAEGGVLGLCEPVLHSSGFGIIAESLGSPKKIAQMMGDARDRIADVAGERFTPKGVYCYMDALPQDWTARPEQLWDEIANAGFEYVVSSVSPGPNRILFRRGDFVVLNMGGYNFFPYSPFMRVNSPAQMVDLERQLAVGGKSGWLVGVIDTPIFAYSSYLNMGESLLSVRDSIYSDVRLGKFFDYIRNGGETHSIVSVTPHTIARYARILDDLASGSASI